ncbi:MAG: histidine kinase [Bacteroidota bacterium]
MRIHLSLTFTGFLLGMLIYGFVNFSGFQNTREFVLSGFLGIFLLYAAHFSNPLIDKLIPWKKEPGQRLLVGILVHSLIGGILVFGILWIYGQLLGTSTLFLSDESDILIKTGILLFCIALIYNIIYFAFHSYYIYSKGQVMEARLKRKQIQLQLYALKSQLSPHFLFNSINTLSSLFQKDTQKAESFIRSLAGSYEYVLNTYESPLVTVAEELSFVESYYFLIKTRFGEHFNLDIKFPDYVLKSKIPPLTLQMLVENAVKHNVMGPSQHLEVKMTVKDKKIRVFNVKTNQRPKMNSLKIGLRNIASRYELLTDKSIEVVDHHSFTVTLPLIS